eukprot:COSAG02_NODE_2579_length_8493_cov_28.456040_2_plen_235_part_00
MYFEELSNFSTLQAVMFPTGVVLTIIGVFILTQRDDSTGGADAESKGGSTGQTAGSGAFAQDGTAAGSQLQPASSTLLGNTPRRRVQNRLDRTHVSQMSLRPSLALSVAGSVGSISATLKAALKAAGEQADRGNSIALQVSNTANAQTEGIQHANPGGVSEDSIVQFARQREIELRQQAGAFATPTAVDTRAGLRNSGASGFMSLHSLNENSISAGLKVCTCGGLFRRHTICSV